MMKKMRMMLAAAALTAAFTACTCAASESAASGEPKVYDLKDTGIAFTVPAEYEEAEGTVTVIAGGEAGSGMGLYFMQIEYCGMSDEEYRTLMAASERTEEIDALIGRMVPLAYIFGAESSKSAEEVSGLLQSLGLEPDGLTEVGSADGYTFYLLMKDFREEGTDLGTYGAAYEALLSNPELLTSSLSFSKPQIPSAMMEGKQLSFTTKDMNGAEVKSDALFAEHKITMVNVWASWCPPCKAEMPDLEKLNAEFAAKDCAIVGILFDGTTEQAIADGGSVISTAGVTYTNLLPWDGIGSDIVVRAYPSTFFVDSSGKVVGEFIEGAYLDRYPVALDNALAEAAGGAAEAAGGAAESAAEPAASSAVESAAG